MKITTVTAVLCLAAAVAAVKIDHQPSYKHMHGSSLARRDGPKGVGRHEDRSKNHGEHHVEAHKDGPKKKDDDGDDDDDDDEKDKDDKEDKNNKDDKDEKNNDKDGRAKKNKGGNKKGTKDKKGKKDNDGDSGDDKKEGKKGDMKGDNDKKDGGNGKKDDGNGKKDGGNGNKDGGKKSDKGSSPAQGNKDAAGNKGGNGNSPAQGNKNEAVDKDGNGNSPAQGNKDEAGNKDGNGTSPAQGNKDEAGNKGGNGNSPAQGNNDATGNKGGNGNSPAQGNNNAAGNKGGNGNAPAGGNKEDKKGVAGSTPNPNTDPNIPRDYASPLWLVQPFGASVWEQGRAYVITWGPNPEPIYAKNLQPKSPVDIRLMKGPPESLHEIAMLKKGHDESLHSFQWTVPASVAPAKDYTIRITHEGVVDTYSHYFEIVKAGDARSSKSNVGEPIELPQKGDVPQPLNKSPIIKPAIPPNPFPTGAPKPSSSLIPPIPVAKPAAHASAAIGPQSANVLAFALTLFGAVYFL